MIIMALDISTKKTGVAIFEDKKLLESQVLKEQDSNVLNRIRKITNKLEVIVDKYCPDIIYAEEPEPAFVGGNLDVYRKLTFAHGDICLMLNDRGMSMKLCTSSHWRKKVGIRTGRNVKRVELKKQAIKLVETEYGKKVTDDEAEAILIGESYVKQYLESFDWS